MKKRIFIIKLLISAGKASATPPIGPIVGQYRLNLLEFCKDFNAQTVSWDESIILPVLIIGYLNGDFEYIIKMPTVNFFLKYLSQKETFSGTPGHKYISIITTCQLYELVFLKLVNSLNFNIIYNNIKILLGTVLSTGIYVIK